MQRSRRVINGSNILEKSLNKVRIHEIVKESESERPGRLNVCKFIINKGEGKGSSGSK